MKKLAMILCAVFFLMQFAPCVRAEETQPDLNLHAKAAVLIDAASGRILYGNKNSSVRLPMASTTKIMTCILALEYGNGEDFAEVSSYAQSMPKVHLSVREGEYYKLSDLLYSLMLQSHNDSAVVIAEHIGGSVEGFAEMMNAKAAEIGCKDTHFVTPNGLDADGHYTTAEELAKIMRYCICLSEKKEEFLEITRTSSYTFTNYRMEDGVMKPDNRTFQVYNTNAFLSMMDGALCGKTGFTSKAGYCYVGALKRENTCLIAAVLACGWPGNKTWKWEDTRKLMEYGLTFTYKEWFSEPELPKIPVLGAKTEESGSKTSKELMENLIRPEKRVPLVMDLPSEQERGMLMKDSDRITMEMELPKTMNAPVKKGTIAGRISYYLNGELFKTYAVTVGESAQKTDFAWTLRKVVEIFTLQFSMG